jgi:hypothetical protein
MSYMVFVPDMVLRPRLAWMGLLLGGDVSAILFAIEGMRSMRHECDVVLRVDWGDT